MISGARVAVADPLDDAVEGRRLDHLAERELDPEGREIILERDQFLAARRFVDAVHHRRLLRLERPGRGDIGGDHIILDQPVGVEPLARRDRHDPPLLVEHHPPFGNIELERLALVARGEQRPPAGPQGFERLFNQFAGTSLRSPASSRATRKLPSRSSLASIAACAFSYAMFAATQIFARVKRQLLSVPSLAIMRWQASAARTCPCFSEQMSADSSSGSIGTTRSGK